MFHMYDKKFISVTSHALDPLSLSQTVTPSRTPSPSSVTYFINYHSGRPHNVGESFSARENTRTSQLFTAADVRAAKIKAALDEDRKSLAADASKPSPVMISVFRMPSTNQWIKLRVHTQFVFVQL